MSSPKLPEQRKVLGLNQRGAGIISGIISLIFGFIIVVLAFRFFFRLFGASPDSAFVSWIYNVSQPFDSPFLGMFNNSDILTTARVEFETLIAIAVYAVGAAIVLGALGWTDRHHHHPA